MKVPFSPPDISQLEIDYVTDVLKSGWITTGPVVKEFEKKIKEFVGSSGAVALGSASASLEGILRYLGVGPGDEVIIPAYTYTATASVVVHVGAKVVMADSACEQFEMDYDRLPELINEHTKAIIPVDLGGMIADYDRLFQIAEEARDKFIPGNPVQEAIGRIAIVADCAHSFGSSLNGRKAGQIADFSAFSFHAVKNLTTAEGGAVTWRNIDGIEDEDVYRFMQLYSLHGQSKDALSKNKAGSWEYDILWPGYKCNMTNINAAIGMAQLERYDSMLRRRKELNENYRKAFSPYGLKMLDHYSNGMKSTGHLFLVRIPGASVEDRNGVISDMAAREIACNVHYKPLPMMTAYKNMGFDIKDFPNAYNQYANLVSIPTYSIMTDEQNKYVIQNFIDVLKGRELI